MANERIPVRDAQGRITGYRGAGDQADKPFNPRPGGLGDLAAKQKPSPSPSVSPPAMMGIDDEKREKYRKMREDEAAEEAKEKKPPMPRKMVR